MSGTSEQPLTADIIGNEIRRHRKAAGLTQKNLADFAGIGKTAVFDIEKGKPTARLKTLLSVLNVLNMRLQLNCPLPKEDEHA
ncbi:MAG: type II toxin-antitoxin system Y4mF family antitoxin [Lentisphaeria bacterium]|nr:type II toxin-antitoxin system Y4mF family antitoxin [Lentisphaeria bacterium]